MNPLELTVRGGAIFLLGVSLSFSAGGFFQARSDDHYQSENYARAVLFAKQSLVYDPNNARSLYLLGLSSWKEWLQTQNDEALVQADRSFSRLIEVHPQFAKGWFYKALSEKQRRVGQRELTSQDRFNFNLKLEKAQALEPHSPWMTIFTALEMLDVYAKEDLTDQKKLILQRIRKALGQHYRYQSSPYLEAVFRRLDRMGYDEDVLQRVTPREAPSYFRLIEYYKLTHDYQAYSKVEPQFALLRRRLNDRLCDQADGWLEDGNRERAEAAYQDALARWPMNARALAGQMSAGSLSMESDLPEALKRLEFLLIQEEEDLSFYWEYLKPIVLASQSSLIQGVFLFRTGRFTEAVEVFQNAETADRPELLRRFFARALIENNEPKRALELLKPVLKEETPDLRDLHLLARVAVTESPIEEPTIQGKMRAAATLKSANDFWKSKVSDIPSLVAEGSFSGGLINLQPGRVQLSILMKLESGLRSRLVTLSIWENDAKQFSGTADVSNGWQKSIFEFETTGGWRWVQVTLEKEVRSTRESRASAQLRLGTLQLESAE